MEPVNNSAVNDGRELTGTTTEFITGRHAESHVKVLLDSADEVVPDRAGNRVHSIRLSSRGDRVNNAVYIFLNEQVSNFSTGEQIVDKNEVLFTLDLTLSK
jgi:hypothetical protein